MRYIRRKDDHLKILASGLVGPGGLGDFDPEVYEEIEGELPEGWQPYRPMDLPTVLSEIFDSQSVALRAKFAPLRAAIQLELELGHFDVAREIINQAEVTPELEEIKAQLLATFDQLIAQ